MLLIESGKCFSVLFPYLKSGINIFEVINPLKKYEFHQCYFFGYLIAFILKRKEAFLSTVYLMLIIFAVIVCYSIFPIDEKMLMIAAYKRSPTGFWIILTFHKSDK